MNRFILKNGSVISEGKTLPVNKSDILIEDGKILDMGMFDNLEIPSFDVSNCFVLPGLIDMHTHLDDWAGDFYTADTYISGSKIAVLNGITTLGTFITESENSLRDFVKDTTKSTLVNCYDRTIKKSFNNSYSDYFWHLTPLIFDDNGKINRKKVDEVNQMMEIGIKTLKLYTTYKKAGICSSYEQIKMFFNLFNNRNISFLIHCEDDETILSSVLKNPDFKNTFTHTLLRPAKAEVTAVKKIVELALENHCKIHIVHISTVEGAEYIYKNKNKIPVTVETCPQYLFLDENYLKGKNGFRYFCTPPLRDVQTIMELKNRAVNGLFDVYASDHCPFLKKDKKIYANDIRLIPSGLPGIGVLGNLILKLFQNDYMKAFSEISLKLSKNPASICGIYPQKGTLKKGSDADVSVFEITNKNYKLVSSLSDVYEPYEEFNGNLILKYVFLRGKKIVENNSLSDPHNFSGKCLSYNELL
ncbi:MAG: amidohydrolase family protein [Ignavibacteria bacterium]|nr:amidohydrolase family protein [Ignavibacteria bacterium]